MFVRFFIVLMLGFGLVAGPAAAEETKPRIAVLELQGNLPRGQLQVLSDKVRSGVLAGLKGRDFVVMSRENMAMLLKDMGLDCEKVQGECEVETGRNIGAAYVVSGSIQDVGSGLMLASLKIHDTKSGALLATGDVRGKEVIELIDKLPGESAQIMARAFGDGGQGGGAPAPVQPNAPAKAQYQLDFGGGGGGLGVQAKLKEQECVRQADQRGSKARASRLADAIAKVKGKARKAWQAQTGELEMCTKLARDQRTGCISAVDSWLAVARAMKVDLPAGVETVKTDCGDRQPAYKAETRTVAADEVSVAESLLVRLKAVDAQAPPVGSQGGGGQSGQDRVLKLGDVSQNTQSEFYRAKAREKRHQVMNFLKDILKNNPPRGEQKAEMLLRLADLYFEEGRDIYLTEKTGGQSHETSSKWMVKSVRIYQLILKTYPQFRRADEATFNLGSVLQQAGKPDAAVKEFTRLVRTYPQSRYAADAYVMIGEYYFDHNNAYKALLSYQAAARYKNSPKYGFALYKLAWCYYNVGEFGKAIDTMKSVVAFSMSTSKGDKDKNRLTLQDEALKDLVRFFADAGEMDEAYAYFSKLGKKDLILAMLERLAKTYMKQGKFAEAARTYRRLIASNPMGPKAGEYQQQLDLALQKMGR